MNKPTKLIRNISLVLCLSFLFGCKPAVKINLPNASWEPIFFKEIDRVSALANLNPLRTVNVNDDDIQVRIWRGFGLDPLEGVVLARTKGIWRGKHIRALYNKDETLAEAIKLMPPKSGWQPLWQSITEKGLLTLPDPSEINCEDHDGLDGTNYVVEINQNNTYRTYRYGGGKCNETQKMFDIGDIIPAEFGSDGHKCERLEWFPCPPIDPSDKLSLRITK